MTKVQSVLKPDRGADVSAHAFFSAHKRLLLFDRPFIDLSWSDCIFSSVRTTFISTHLRSYWIFFFEHTHTIPVCTLSFALFYFLFYVFPPFAIFRTLFPLNIAI